MWHAPASKRRGDAIAAATSAPVAVMSIVFGTTLLADCELYAEVAARFAQRMNTQLRLVHVSQDSRAAIVLGTHEEHVLGPIRASLQAEAARLAELTQVNVQTQLAAGEVARSLVSIAEYDLASILILGGESRSAALLGATAERTARASTVPVLALREPERLLAWLRRDRPLRVLVGADFNRPAEAARAFAMTLARLGPCIVDVTLVVSPQETHKRLGLPAPATEHVLSVEATQTLHRELQRFSPAHENNVSLRLVPARGSADAHLVSLADSEDFDMIVVGQRQRSLIEQLWYGSVARGVLRASPVSVACVPVGPSSSKPPFRVPHVVVAATDFSDVGDRAFTQARGMVADGGVLHLAHVISSIAPSSVAARQASEQAWYTLSRLAETETRGERAPHIECHILEGEPGPQLLALTERLGADLVVLGARSHSVLTSALLGSVAQFVTSNARVPVLLVPSVVDA